MRIRIDHPHIADGEKGSAHFCPIAHACKAVGLDVSVGPDFIELYRDGAHVASLPLPPRVVEWREAFDCGLHVSPTEFDLLLPEEFAVVSPSVFPAFELVPA